MKITNKFLDKQNACKEGRNYYSINKFKSDRELLLSCQRDKHDDWANWVLVRLMTRKQKVRYACFAAKQVLHLFEKEFPDDARPRQAISAALKCARHNTKKNREASRVASEAVSESSWAASRASEAASW